MTLWHATTIIDKSNNFIQITAIICKVKFVFKDSMRIFPLSLDDFCKSMGVSSKFGKYKPEYNNIELLSNKDTDLYKEFIEYSTGDTTCLLEALLKAQT